VTRLVAVVALAAIGLVLWPTPFALSDHRVFVEAGRLVLEGRSPYDGQAWTNIAREVGSPYIATLAQTTGVWPHPPWVAYAFVPFALLPREVGPWALHLTLLVAGIAGVVLLVEHLTWRSDSVHALALAVGVTFQPLVIGIRWGQLAPLLLLGFALLVTGLERRRTVPIVASALLLALKPHVVVILAFVSAALLARRVPRGLAAAGAVLAVVCGTTLVLDRGWFDAATRGYATRLDGLSAYSTTYALGIDVAGSAWPIAAGALIAVTIIACVVAARATRRDHDELWLLAVATTLSLVLVPYAWPTDQALLLVVALLALRAADRSAGAVRALHLGLTVIVMTALPWIAFLASAPRPTQALEAIVPIAAALLLAQSARLNASVSAGGAPMRTSRPPRTASPPLS
jgi:hypothetical protein